jgi:hypothetical protein
MKNEMIKAMMENLRMGKIFLGTTVVE